jgi:hypothetical protein
LNNGENTITRSGFFPDPVIFSGSLAAVISMEMAKMMLLPEIPWLPYPDSFGLWGNPGQLWLCCWNHEQRTASISPQYARILGTANSSANFGSALATGDLNGDGFEDLVVGASGAPDTAAGAGGFHVLYGPQPG